MHKVYLSLGSNIDAEKNLKACARILREEFDQVEFSKVYRSPSAGFSGADFLNAVARIETDLEPLVLRDALQKIEDEHGRIRGAKKFSDRTLDIDILLYDDLIFSRDKLDIPRDEILKYAFVIGPLAEINPSGLHPQTGSTFQSIWLGLAPEDRNSLQLDACKI